MTGFLHWSRSIVVGTLNGVVKFTLFLVFVVVALILIGLARGDGLPGNMVLALDLRQSIVDSAQPTPFDIGRSTPTVMDIVLGLDDAQRDSRVKGLVMRLGGGGLSVASAEEIDAAVKRFRASGKFVIAYSHGFLSTGLGDYLAATSADRIWMQPDSTFSPSGTGAGEIFLRGLLDKIQAEPQIVKRADFKSAADMFMEKGMTDPDRVQLTALLQSVYDSATEAASQDRKLPKQKLVDVLDASPQFAGDAKKAGLVDTLGYDDDADAAAIARAGDGAKSVSLVEFLRTKEHGGRFDQGPRIALIAASGEIVDGKSSGGFGGGSNVIASDDLSKAIRAASKDREVRAIVLRVDSPGGSVSASDQILDAVKKAQARGKPVVISMANVAASGGYYISASANRIVAEPGTITGSIGVLTGKVSIGKSLSLIGVGADQIGVGKNALFDSSLTPFTPQQWAALNAEADTIYNDFMHKVSVGRKLPFEKVQQIAKGRVWSGADAKARGLVDDLGGLWVATDDAKRLAGIPSSQSVVFKRYPEEKSFFAALSEFFGGSMASAKAIEGLSQVMATAPVRSVIGVLQATPRGQVELRATNLPSP